MVLYRKPKRQNQYKTIIWMNEIQYYNKCKHSYGASLIVSLWICLKY